MLKTVPSVDVSMQSLENAGPEEANTAPIICPLLVKVQSIDIQKLDFKSGTPRNRHVTCIEATNQFLFLGCISGTVYVFRRKDLSFLFIIPFKGGKVCSLTSSENELDLVVGSVRGIISIFRISPNTLGREDTALSSNSILTHLCTVSHHNQNEITETVWSPNGKFLFIGDNQGLISQIEVGSYDELSKNIPSKVILKLKSRIVQMCFAFPYLAVATLAGVYLCDIENEQFTRIQVQPKVDVKSTGVCFVHVKQRLKRSSELLLSLNLFVAEANTGYIHTFDMEGIKLTSSVVNMSAVTAERSMKLFDPIYVGGEMQDDSLQIRPESSQILGKLFVTDDGLIVSSCRDQCVYVLEPTKMQLLLWCEDFLRINNLKVVSNYMFVGSGSQMKVVSSTQFRPYGEQLLKAGLVDVLQRWIQHAVSAAGCLSRNSSENNCRIDVDENNGVIGESAQLEARMRFQNFMTDFNDDEEFSGFVIRHLPFQLNDGVVKEARSSLQTKLKSPYLESVENFVQILRSQIAESEIYENCNLFGCISELFESLARVYEVHTMLPVCLSETTPSHKDGLQDVMLSLKEFYQRHNALMMPDFKSTLSDTISENLLSQLIAEYLQRLKSLRPDKTIDWTATPHNPPIFFNFTKFAKQNFIRQWVSTYYEEQCDYIVADALVYLMPLLSPHLIYELWSRLQLTGFFSWLVYANFFNPNPNNRDNYLLSFLFNEKSTQRDYSGEIITSIYRDLLGSDISQIAKTLHHFVTVIYFTSPFDYDPRECEKESLELLLSCFPLRHWPDEEIKQRLTDMCHMNLTLLNMLKAACLSDQKSIRVCKCGFPLDIQTDDQRQGITRVQRIMEETVLKLLVHNYDFKLSQQFENQERRRDGFHFAMQRSLFEAFLSEPLLKNEEEIRIEIFLRTNSCAILRNLNVNPNTINLLLKKQNELLGTLTCKVCGENISRASEQIVSSDCIGLWILNGHSNPRESLRLLQKSYLNTPGQFSLKFYQLALNCFEKKRKLPESYSTTGKNCSVFH